MKNEAFNHSIFSLFSQDIRQLASKQQRSKGANQKMPGGPGTWRADGTPATIFLIVWTQDN